MSQNTDVFVIGGGPAGLAAAIAARGKGMHVMLADQSPSGADKACGEGLMPETLDVLRRLGVEIPGSEGRPYRGIRFLNQSQTVEACFPSSYGLGIRRTALHAILTEHAAAAGVHMLWQTSVLGIAREGIQLAQGLVKARWIVAADGGNSKVRAWCGLEPASPPRRRFGFRRHYAVTPWTDRVEVHWGDDCQFYTAPVGAEEVCVALLSRSPKLRIAEALPRFSVLAARLQSASQLTPERGDVRHRLPAARVSRKRGARRRRLGRCGCHYRPGALSRVLPGSGAGGCTRSG